MQLEMVRGPLQPGDSDSLSVICVSGTSRGDIVFFEFSGWARYMYRSWGFYHDIASGAPCVALLSLGRWSCLYYL
jgi:hypothetical protein